ncbi:MAG: hypothetical protein NC410_08925 [Oscillibacter sp.]|nr:hypothetical protein [Oscillibacter sp.]
METSKIIRENQRRIELYFRDYDRITGDPTSEVIPREKFIYGNHTFYFPQEMTKMPIYKALQSTSIHDILVKYSGSYTPEKEKEFTEGIYRDRLKYDFEYWAFICVKIQDKLTKRPIPFKLNRGQRRLIGKYEEMRIAGIPIRVILVKARQWGGSTATQIYMLWLQLFHYENWHSVVVAQYITQAANVRSMIAKTIAAYPKSIHSITITGYEGMTGIKYIPQRGCIIGVGTSENPDAFRSFDFSMIHLSEVGLWKSTHTKSADDIVQSLYATVPDVPGTFICMESTAKGTGNFFHKQYLAAKNKESYLQDVFVPWFEIEMYAYFKSGRNGEILHDKNGLPISELEDKEKFISTLTEYEWFQWNAGATLEGIHWYRASKKKQGFNDFQMKSEYPTTAEEAFQSNSARYYEEEYTNYCYSTCRAPKYIGDIRGYSLKGKDALKNIQFVEDGNGLLAVWEKPEIIPGEKITNRYLVVVDIGGKHHKSDWSVISVFDRLMLSDPNGALERVATYIAHIDHDILAWKAAQIAAWYDNALLVIESNTLETKDRKKGESVYEGDHFFTVLNEIADVYDNLYARKTDPDKTIEGAPIKYGWHTNKRTKYLAYDTSRAVIRDREYIERDLRCVDEMGWLETKTDGTLGAIEGQHDDIIDTTAIGIYVSSEEMPLPKKVQLRQKAAKKEIIGGIATI